MARFGLKVITLNELWRRANIMQAEFFYHQYLFPIEDYEGKNEEGELAMLPGKLTQMKQTLERWHA